MIIEKIKKIRPHDITDLLIFLIFIPFGKIGKLVLRDVWIVSERPDEAQDNGYWFFKYIHEKNLHNRTYYIIKKTSKDFQKIHAIAPDRVIKYGSFKHYLFYIISRIHYSAHIGGGMVNSRVIKILEKYKLISNLKVFLQHGITMNVLEWAYKDASSVDLFCCSSSRELNFVKNNFGYKDSEVILTGLCRFDNLNSCKTKKQILLMPTWRSYLKFKNEDSINEFTNSEFFKKYERLLNDIGLIDLLEKNGYTLIFYPHSEMQPYLQCFTINNNRIKLANKDEYDVQTLLKESELLITDYSSVFFDFAYMKKPCIYYQFDYEDFRKGHWKEGYFNYQNDAFGPVVSTKLELLESIKKYTENNVKLEVKYVQKVDDFFAYTDTNNCKRIYENVTQIADRI